MDNSVALLGKNWELLLLDEVEHNISQSQTSQWRKTKTKTKPITHQLDFSDNLKTVVEQKPK